MSESDKHLNLDPHPTPRRSPEFITRRNSSPSRSAAIPSVRSSYLADDNYNPAKRSAASSPAMSTAAASHFGQSSSSASAFDRMDRDRELPAPSSLGKRSRSPSRDRDAHHRTATKREDDEIDELASTYDPSASARKSSGDQGGYESGRLPPMQHRPADGTLGGTLPSPMDISRSAGSNFGLPPPINRLDQPLISPTNPSYHVFSTSSPSNHASTNLPTPTISRPRSPGYDSLRRYEPAPQHPPGTGSAYHSISPASADESFDRYRKEGSAEAGGMGGGGTGSGSGTGKGDLPARRQNVACDGCRGRKVKCNRVPGADKCEHCKAKGLQCTSHYVTQVSSARKQKQASKDPTLQLRVQDLDSTRPGLPLEMLQGLAPSSGGRAYQKGSGSSGPVDAGEYGIGRGVGLGISDGGSGRAAKRMKTDSGMKGDIHSYLDPQTQLSHLLSYLLAPSLIHSSPLGYRDWAGRQGEMGWPLAPTFDGQPSSAHKKLLSEEDRREFADDLMETYFSIVHIRLPILDINSFKRRFRHPNVDPEGLPSLPLVACVLAWGAKFSEHPLIMQDRDECSLGLQDGRKRSRLVQMMTCRAQEVLETHKVFRVATLDNVHAAMMAAMMNGTDIADPLHHKPYWPSVAVSHIIRLGYNKRSTVLNLRSHNERTRAQFAFWLSTWMDAITGCYYRSQPLLHDDDVDLDPLHSFDGEGLSDTSSTEAIKKYVGWHTALNSLSRICRQIAVQINVPKTERSGIPLATLRNFTAMLSTWREDHLKTVGVPTVWPADWNFVAAVTACASDSNYHVLWVILSKAISEFGISELKTIERGDFKGSLEESNSLRMEAERTRDRIAEEALHGALRISALAAVLAANSYLRLDPNVLFYAIYNAGMLLAKLGRREVSSCISGMRQYGLAYEEAFDRVDELERIVAGRTLSQQPPPTMFGGPQMNSMPSGIPIMHGFGRGAAQQMSPMGFTQMPMQNNFWPQPHMNSESSRNNGVAGGMYYNDR